METSPSTTTGAAGDRSLEALLRLNRAVQRATIYPEGHPSIPAAVAPLAEALRAAFEARPSLTIGVTSERLLADGEPVEERRGALDWLNQHLRERGLASIVLRRELTEEDLTRFVLWLARSREDEASELPRFGGIVLTPVDYSHARFGEGPASDKEAQADPARVWKSLLGGLTAGWYAGEAESLSDDPEAAAAEISGEIERNEGVGGAAVVSRVVAAGARLGHLPDPVRQVVKRRLASFIGGLSAGLRSQLLRVDARTSAQKLEFLTEMTEALPDTTVMEILADLDVAGGRVPPQFLTLMSKLIGLSAREQLLEELAETKLESLGLPRGLTGMDPEQVREVLAEVLESRATGDWSPEPYKALLGDLSGRRVAESVRRPAPRYGEIESAEAVSAHVADVVLHLLVTLPEHPEAPSYLRRLIAHAPKALAAGWTDQLHDAATAVRDLAKLRSYLPAEVVSLADEYLAFFTRVETAVALVAAIEASEDALPAPLAGLFELAGLQAALAAFERVGSLGDSPARDRLAGLLAALDPDTFGAAVARIRATGGASLRGLFHVARMPGAAGGVELALTFLGNKDPAVRLEALRTIFASDGHPGLAERHLEKALLDEDAEVVAFALEQAGCRPGPAAVTALRALVSDAHRPRALARFRFRAVETLAGLPAPEAQRALADLLRDRRLLLRPREVRLSQAIEEALKGAGDESALQAAAAWRRSPAGWMGWFLGPRPTEEQ